MVEPSSILTLSCPNRPGIVAAVSGRLFEAGCNILDAQQFDDTETGRFFMRVVFNPVDGPGDPGALRQSLTLVAERFGMAWILRHRAERRKVLLLVSKFDHCLADLLYRVRIGELAMEVVGIVSNHPRDVLVHSMIGDIPFHHLPVTPKTKPAQEGAIKAIAEKTGAELVVLARYMQILSNDFAA